MGFAARDVMQPAVHTVPPNMSIVDLERTLCDSGDSGFPVVNADGRLVGVVSRTDIVRKLSAEQSFVEYEADYYRDYIDHGAGRASTPADVASEVGRRLDALRVEDVMSGAPITVQEATPIADVARTLVDRRIHRVPVVESGALVGIVTTTDIVKALADGRIG